MSETSIAATKPRVAAAQERRRVGGADHERVAEQRDDVLLEVDPGGLLGERAQDELLDRPAERELLEDRVERLVLVAVRVRVDHDGERRVLGQVAQRAVERARGVIAAAAAEGRHRATHGEQAGKQG